MARQASKKSATTFHEQTSWRLMMLAGFLLVSYGFFSWAINSGNILAWGLGFFFLGWAVNNLIRLLGAGLRAVKK